MRIIRGKKLLIVIFVLVLSIFFGFVIYRKVIHKPPTQSTPQTTPPASQSAPQSQPTSETKEKKLPSSYDLTVPFVPQAPFGVWDNLHDNACEEASIILVHYYKIGKSLSREQADSEINKMVNYEIKKYGKHKDLTAQETADLAKEFYGYKNVKVAYDFSWDDVKREIANNNPVIVPAAGRLLNNPNFRQPGPVYHMLVIRGYTQNEIITNDVGTRKGESYKYSYQTLDGAIHDWTENPNIIQDGKRAMLVLEN